MPIYAYIRINITTLKENIICNIHMVGDGHVHTCRMDATLLPALPRTELAEAPGMIISTILVEGFLLDTSAKLPPLHKGKRNI